MSYADIVAQAYTDALTKTAADSAPVQAPKDGGEGFIKKTFKAPGRGLRNATAGAANAALAGDAGAMAHIKKGLAKGLQSHYAPHVAALGGIAAGLGAAGYGTKKYLEHQNNKMKYASEGEENMYIPYMDKSAALTAGEARRRGKTFVGQTSQKEPVGFVDKKDFEDAKINKVKAKGKLEQGREIKAPSLMSRIGAGYDKYSGANYLRGKGANKWVARGAAPAAVAALGAGGAYLYNRNKKTKAAAATEVAKKAEDKASMTERFKKGYSKYSGANKIMRGGDSLQKNNPKGGGYWSGAKRQLGKAMSNKYVAHGALPTALGAAGLGSAYAYNQYKKKNKSASLEAEIFNQTLLDINTETAFLEELAEWKEANFDFGY